jgi:hypothetical protein
LLIHYPRPVDPPVLAPLLSRQNAGAHVRHPV